MKIQCTVFCRFKSNFSWLLLNVLVVNINKYEQLINKKTKLCANYFQSKYTRSHFSLKQKIQNNFMRFIRLVQFYFRCDIPSIAWKWKRAIWISSSLLLLLFCCSWINRAPKVFGNLWQIRRNQSHLRLDFKSFRLNSSNWILSSENKINANIWNKTNRAITRAVCVCVALWLLQVILLSSL